MAGERGEWQNRLLKKVLLPCCGVSHPRQFRPILQVWNRGITVPYAIAHYLLSR